MQWESALPYSRQQTVNSEKVTSSDILNEEG